MAAAETSQTVEALARHLRDLPLETVFDTVRLLVERAPDGGERLAAWAQQLMVDNGMGGMMAGMMGGMARRFGG